MKRVQWLAVFILFIVLCVSAAYWAMQLFKPAVRPVAAPPPSKAEVRPDAAAGLFGGRPAGTAVASNYQLHGVVVSGSAAESIAILAADGKPAQAIRMNMEIMPGVRIKEVHPQYVLLTEDGVTKRVDLPDNAKDAGGVGRVNLARTPIPVPGAAPMPPPVMNMQNPQTGNNPVVVNGMPNYSQQAQPNANNQQPPGGQPQVYQPPASDTANSPSMGQTETQSHSANMPTEAPNAEPPGGNQQNATGRPGFGGAQSGMNTR